MPSRVAAAIAAFVSVGGLRDGDFLFSAEDHTTALDPTAFGRLVKATFKTYGGVAMCPKDVRSAFITFLRDGYEDGQHDDAVLAGAAKAMRHSSAMQQSMHCACAPDRTRSSLHADVELTAAPPILLLSHPRFADDKHKSQRTVSAAMSAADAFAGRYAL